jgi:hypothetical protein
VSVRSLWTSPRADSASCDSLGFLESDRESVTVSKPTGDSPSFLKVWRGQLVAGDAAVHRPVKVNPAS